MSRREILMKEGELLKRWEDEDPKTAYEERDELA